MNTLKFIYQETEIHFSLQNEGNVMVNATEMAKLFNRRTKDFLKTDNAKAFIKVLERSPYGARLESERALNGARSDFEIIDNRGHMGIFFERRLALKFAAWLSPEFEVWVFSTLDNLIFGNYKKHWEAHAQQEIAKVAMDDIKTEILHNPTPESVAEYFKHERDYKNAKNKKTKAIRSQLKLFNIKS